MQCHEIRSFLNPLIEGELDGPQTAELEAHLASCQACRSELEGLKRSVRLVESLPLLSTPPRLVSRVMTQVLQREEAHTAAGGIWGWILAAVLSGLGSLLLYGYLGEAGLPWDASTLEAIEPIGLESLASLMVSLEVGVVIGATLLFAGMAILLVQLVSRELRCQHG